MAETAHTQGPWQAVSHFDAEAVGKSAVAWTAGISIIADSDAFSDEEEANARLIAAAPDLSECAKIGWRMCHAMILAAEQAGEPLPNDHYAIRDLPKFVAALAKAGVRP